MYLLAFVYFLWLSICSDLLFIFQLLSSYWCIVKVFKNIFWIQVYIFKLDICFFKLFYKVVYFTSLPVVHKSANNSMSSSKLAIVTLLILTILIVVCVFNRLNYLEQLLIDWKILIYWNTGSFHIWCTQFLLLVMSYTSIAHLLQ